MSVVRKVFQILCSLKMAMLVIFSLAVALGVGTVIESLYDIPTAQYWIYRSVWFQGILATLGLNIFCVAMSRYPWKPRHIPFLVAHVGILTLLTGSWITERSGIDGSLRITEGETSSQVELDSNLLVISDGTQVHATQIKWIPPGVKFKPFQVLSGAMDYNLKVDEFLSHADPTISFIPNPQAGAASQPAIRVNLAGGPMGVSHDFWLWTGASDSRSVQAGPAQLSLGKQESSEKGTGHEGLGRANQPWLNLLPEVDGGVSYLAHSSSGKNARGKLAKNHLVGQRIDPGWKGKVILTIQEWIPDAIPLTTYHPSRVQYGNQAPTSAIHLAAPDGAEVWLGLGDRAVLHLKGRDVGIGYFPKRIILPFSVRLNQFTVAHDPGTTNPASFASQVTVLESLGQKEVNISMNEPLDLRGYTIYQASYEERDPRPITSIFSVNRDPGRVWKYFGSILIVLGTIALFGMKYFINRKPKNLRQSSLVVSGTEA